MEILKILKKTYAFLKEGIAEKESSPYIIISEGNIKAGAESYHNGNFIVKGVGSLKIGKYCAFGQDIKIILSNHRYSYPSLQYTFYRKNFGRLPYQLCGSIVTIGNDVWIGDSVIILPGIEIGHGAIIGGGSVVTKNVEPFSIVGGNPAKVIRKRFTNEKIEELLQLEWWNWSEETIKKNQDFFFNELH